MADSATSAPAQPPPPSMPPPPPPSGVPADARDDNPVVKMTDSFPQPELANPLIQAIETSVQDISKLMDLVENFYDGAQDTFNGTLNSLVQDLEQVDRLRDSFNVTIPQSVLEHVDRKDGNNPVMFTKERIDAAMGLREENERFCKAVREIQKGFKEEAK